MGGAGPAEGGGAGETIEALREGGVGAAGVVSIEPLRADSALCGGATGALGGVGADGGEAGETIEPLRTGGVGPGKDDIDEDLSGHALDSLIDIFLVVSFL